MLLKRFITDELVPETPIKNVEEEFEFFNNSNKKSLIFVKYSSSELLITI